MYNTQGLQSLGFNVGVNLLRMLDKEYRLHLPGFANDLIMILFYTNTAWFQTVITRKQPKTIQIPLLLPGVRPVSNLFKFKKKWVMRKGMLFNSQSIVGPMSTNSNVALDWHLFNSPSIFGQMSTNSYALIANLCWPRCQLRCWWSVVLCLDQGYWLSLPIDS